jgi:hypothetical protein
MITGTIQTTKTNDYGFTAYKINGVWYGADAQGPPRASEGETVSFEDFQKTGKDGRTWPSLKLATFKKVAATVGNTGATSAVASPGKAAYVGATSNRDSYWTDKAALDAAKDPRISLQGAYKVAVEFLPVVLAQGALPSFDKAKATAKLEILRSFLDEEALRIHTASYAATVPAKAAPAAQPAAEREPGSDDEKELDNPEVWS